MNTGKIIITAAIIFAISAIPVQAQVQSVEDIVPPTPQFQDHGGVTPWFWIGLQTVFGAGYNFETTAGGFRNYGGDNYTYASFNLAFVDSHYQVPKFYEVPREIDPDAWTGHFVLLNFTSRINSWENGTTGVENNSPAWLAEITGMGIRAGFFTQAANLVGGLFDSDRSSATSSNPITKIAGGNKVINLRDGQLGKLYYEKSTDTITSTIYQTSSSEGGIWYAGYEKKELWNAYLTMLSQGNVNSDVSDGKNKGAAGVIDFEVSPFGLFTDEDAPITFNVTGNAITGFRWQNITENFGFGLKGEGGIWLGRDNFVLLPVMAFDGKIDSNNKFHGKFGTGLTFRFSGMRWTSDDWNDLYSADRNAGNLANFRYENREILKYAYAQIYGSTIPQKNGKSDFNILIRAEEPDGNTGFHNKLGCMAELRLYNLLQHEKKSNGEFKERKWEAQGRVSWDFNIKQYLVTPYMRAYVNDDAVFKLRLGAYANIIPFTGFELAYTSANLNNRVDLPKPNYLNKSYKSYFDAGRIELLIILKSDEMRPVMPKRMSEWNYPTVISQTGN